MAGDEAYILAAEQFLWWRDQGLSHHEMLQAVGVWLPWPVDAAETVQLLANAERDRALVARAMRKRWAA